MQKDWHSFFRYREKKSENENEKDLFYNSSDLIYHLGNQFIYLEYRQCDPLLTCYIRCVLFARNYLSLPENSKKRKYERRRGRSYDLSAITIGI